VAAEARLRQPPVPGEPVGLGQEITAESGPTRVRALWVDFLLACAGTFAGFYSALLFAVIPGSSGSLIRLIAAVIPTPFIILFLNLPIEPRPANRSHSLTRSLGAGVGWGVFWVAFSTPSVNQAYWALFYYSIPLWSAAALSAAGAVAAGLVVAEAVWRRLIRGRRG